MIHPRVQSEKQRIVVVPYTIQWGGMVSTKSDARKITWPITSTNPPYPQKQTPINHNNDVMGKDYLDVLGHDETNLLVNVINRLKGGIGKVGVDRPSKAAHVDAIKETLLSEMGLRPKAGNTGRTIPLDVLISIQWSQLRNAPGDVGNQIHGHMNLV